MKFTQAEIAAWPPGHKKCRECQVVKPLDDFHKNPKTLFGVNTVCKSCRRPSSARRWISYSNKSEHRVRLMYNSAKYRAKIKGWDFDITEEDIVIPERCPVFGVALDRNKGPWSPSLDRIDSSRGYVKGNVQVISTRANLLKNNATADELRMLADWMSGGSSESGGGNPESGVVAQGMETLEGEEAFQEAV